MGPGTGSESDRLATLKTLPGGEYTTIAQLPPELRAQAERIKETLLSIDQGRLQTLDPTVIEEITAKFKAGQNAEGFELMVKHGVIGTMNGITSVGNAATAAVPTEVTDGITAAIPGNGLYNFAASTAGLAYGALTASDDLIGALWMDYVSDGTRQEVAFSPEKAEHVAAFYTASVAHFTQGLDTREFDLGRDWSTYFSAGVSMVVEFATYAWNHVMGDGTAELPNWDATLAQKRMDGVMPQVKENLVASGLVTEREAAFLTNEAGVAAVTADGVAIALDGSKRPEVDTRGHTETVLDELGADKDAVAAAAGPAAAEVKGALVNPLGYAAGKASDAAEDMSHGNVGGALADVAAAAAGLKGAQIAWTGFRMPLTDKGLPFVGKTWGVGQLAAKATELTSRMAGAVINTAAHPVDTVLGLRDSLAVRAYVGDVYRGALTEAQAGGYTPKDAAEYARLEAEAERTRLQPQMDEAAAARKGNGNTVQRGADKVAEVLRTTVPGLTEKVIDGADTVRDARFRSAPGEAIRAVGSLARTTINVVSGVPQLAGAGVGRVIATVDPDFVQEARAAAAAAAPKPAVETAAAPKPASTPVAKPPVVEGPPTVLKPTPEVAGKPSLDTLRMQEALAKPGGMRVGGHAVLGAFGFWTADQQWNSLGYQLDQSAGGARALSADVSLGGKLTAGTVGTAGLIADGAIIAGARSGMLNVVSKGAGRLGLPILLAAGGADIYTAYIAKDPERAAAAIGTLGGGILGGIVAGVGAGAAAGAVTGSPTGPGALATGFVGSVVGGIGGAFIGEAGMRRWGVDMVESVMGRSTPEERIRDAIPNEVSEGMTAQMKALVEAKQTMIASSMTETVVGEGRRERKVTVEGEPAAEAKAAYDAALAVVMGDATQGFLLRSASRTLTEADAASVRDTLFIEAIPAKADVDMDDLSPGMQALVEAKDLVRESQKQRNTNPRGAAYNYNGAPSAEALANLQAVYARVIGSDEAAVTYLADAVGLPTPEQIRTEHKAQIETMVYESLPTALAHDAPAQVKQLVALKVEMDALTAEALAQPIGLGMFGGNDRMRQLSEQHEAKREAFSVLVAESITDPKALAYLEAVVETPGKEPAPQTAEETVIAQPWLTSALKEVTTGSSVCAADKPVIPCVGAELPDVRRTVVALH